MILIGGFTLPVPQDHPSVQLAEKVFPYRFIVVQVAEVGVLVLFPAAAAAKDAPVPEPTALLMANPKLAIPSVVRLMAAGVPGLPGILALFPAEAALKHKQEPVLILHLPAVALIVQDRQVKVKLVILNVAILPGRPIRQLFVLIKLSLKPAIAETLASLLAPSPIAPGHRIRLRSAQAKLSLKLETAAALVNLRALNAAILPGRPILQLFVLARHSLKLAIVVRRVSSPVLRLVCPTSSFLPLPLLLLASLEESLQLARL